MQSIVLAFVPFFGPKTADAIRNEVQVQLAGLGLTDEQQTKLFVTTDEGSNILQQGGDQHINCMCHFGALLAKRATEPYRRSQIDGQIKEKVAMIRRLLSDLEEFVRGLK